MFGNRVICSAPVEQPIADHGVDVRVEIQEVAEGMEGQDHTRRAISAIQNVAEKLDQAFIGQPAQDFKQRPVPLEEAAQRHRQAEYVMPVRDSRDYIGDQELDNIIAEIKQKQREQKINNLLQNDNTN